MMSRQGVSRSRAIASSRLLLLLSTLFYMFSVCASTYCFECSSLNETYCPEQMVDDDERIISFNDCSYIHEGSYCVKAVGIIGGSLGTRRFCSSKDLGNYCEYIRRPGDQREYRSCVYTCTGDGCNGTSGPNLPSLWFLVASSVLSLFLHFRNVSCAPVFNNGRRERLMLAPVTR